MAENDKGQMDAEVRAALAGFKNLTWHTRTGAPHCVSDLEGIAAGQAQTVILLHPETIEVCFGPCNVGFTVETNSHASSEPAQSSILLHLGGSIEMQHTRSLADALHADAWLV